MTVPANQDHDPLQLERIGAMLEAGKLDAALQAAGFDPEQFRRDMDAIAKIAARQEVPSHEIIRTVRDIKAQLTEIEQMLFDAYGPDIGD